jgi:O-methyltransferase
MKQTYLTSIAFLKGFILAMRPHLYLGWLEHALRIQSSTLMLSKWIADQNKHDVFNDFYAPFRDYSKRRLLHQHVVDRFGLNEEAFDYFEFGVCNGDSFRWWLEHCLHPESRFYGFDTFEGLPEKWGAFEMGAMAANIPVIEGNRHEFIQGLFQETMQPFLHRTRLDTGRRKVIHLDADLFSSTLFVLTSLAPHLKPGDILLFDEFNVPNHEFLAFHMFTESYYVKTKLIGAVNNYYQTALVVESC